MPHPTMTPSGLYVTTVGGIGLLHGMVFTIYGLYAVRTAGLSPLELTLAGALLELTVFVAEIPTGVVADAYGRRLSVLIGLCVVGTGIATLGAVPAFWCIALGSMLWGLGGTFISGAHQAWLADEIGDVQAAPVYLRATQFGQIGSLAGIPIAVVLAWRHLQLPLWVSGAGFFGLAGLLLLVMPERGYRPAAPTRRGAWRAMRGTLRDGLGIVRGRSAVLAMFVITVLYGMSSEAFSRLTPFHLLDDVGLPPSFAEATWFGILTAGAALGGAVVTGLVRRSAALHTPRFLAQILLALTTVMTLGTVVFALSGVFWLALIAAWLTRCVRIATRPLMLAWVNRGLRPEVRATVLSMLGQSEALGEITGAPILGVVATLHTVRTALLGAAVVLLPAFPLFGYALRRDEKRV
jgi:DHA3 family tetracycline resistance protein-like MFS transporter